MHKSIPKRRWWYVAAVIVGVGLILMYSAPWWNPIVFPPVKDPIYGVSFSDKRAREFGVDWQANYTALLDDMQIRHFRLMSYWDEYEKTRGQFDFSGLDWQMDEAAKRGAKVSLAIGIRQPRWPECHEPAWARQLTGHTWKQALYAYLEVVVKRYENHPALESWQLENEPLNNLFGECQPGDRERLREEYALVDSLTTKPIYMSLSDQHGLPLNVPWPDKFGYSVYRIVWSTGTWPYVGYITYPTPIWYHRLRAVAIKAITGRDIFIHELQMEPWAGTSTKYASIAEQDKSMSVNQIEENFHYARMIGTREIYAWGSEWWYWRRETLGDPTIWEKVRDELRQP